MFTHKIEGNTLYINRTKDDIHIYKPWQHSCAASFFTLAVGCFAFNEDQKIGLYLLGIASVIAAFWFEWLYYQYRRKQYTIKITKPPGASIVIVNNTVYNHPYYLYNVAQLIYTSPYIIYLTKKDGDSHPIVNHILEREDMYAMMELIASYLEIQCRKDN